MHELKTIDRERGDRQSKTERVREREGVREREWERGRTLAHRNLMHGINIILERSRA